VAVLKHRINARNFELS